MDEKVVNKEAVTYLIHLIHYYEQKENTLFLLIDKSYSAFLDYVNARDFLSHLKNLYYKLTNKEI